MNAALLDTDMTSEVLKQRNVNVGQHSKQYLRSHGQFAISAVTRFEIVRGYKDVKATTQLSRFMVFCGHTLILTLTDAIFDRAADLWVLAGQGGFPRADADLLIAATALEHGRNLVTGNSVHFAWIPGLVIEDWRQP